MKTPMIRIMLTILFIGAVVAWAQDRSISVREQDVQLVAAEVRVLSDAGCVLIAIAQINPPSPDIVYARTQQTFNGARCTTFKTAALQAAKNDIGVGTGAAP